jgi:hypothetical protein
MIVITDYDFLFVVNITEREYLQRNKRQISYASGSSESLWHQNTMPPPVRFSLKLGPMRLYIKKVVVAVSISCFHGSVRHYIVNNVVIVVTEYYSLGKGIVRNGFYIVTEA